jgi:transposase
MRPYSMDLRERVAAAVDEGEGPQREIARIFRVSLSFVSRLLQRQRQRTLAPAAGGGPTPVLAGRPAAGGSDQGAQRRHPGTASTTGQLQL